MPTARRPWLLPSLASLFVLAFSAPAHAADDYKLGPDSQRQDGVPQGKVTQMPKWTDSKVFPGTERDWWVYVPHQYDGKQPACLMVFQDGRGPVQEKGEFKAPIVFDNLIHRKEMPVTIGVFIDPGNDPKRNPPPKAGEKRDRPFRPSNRSVEYDTLSDAYATFLLLLRHANAGPSRPALGGQPLAPGIYDERSATTTMRARRRGGGGA